MPSARHRSRSVCDPNQNSGSLSILITCRDSHSVFERLFPFKRNLSLQTIYSLSAESDYLGILLLEQIVIDWSVNKQQPKAV